MTFEDINVGEYKSNPYTQDISKAKDNRTFQQSPMSRIEHEDPSLHYIGESLPKPGDSEATWAGQVTSVGVSPIPARADHSHDSYLRYGLYTRPALGYASGQSLVPLTYSVSENYLVSSTLMLLPDTGLWEISGSIYIARDGGASFPANTIVYLLLFYHNGTVSRFAYKANIGGVNSEYGYTFNDTIFYNPSHLATSTFEMAYFHNDAATHIITINHLTVIRKTEY